MKLNSLSLFSCFMLILTLHGCSQPKEETVVEIKRYPIDSLEGVMTQSGLEIDREVSSDGNGSLRIIASEPTLVRLFETGDVDVEDARLVYQARVRAKGLEGKAYLEMWCSFQGRGEFFSRGLEAPLNGNVDWTSLETPFFLQKGENPDNVKLNFVVEGKGTVWIDDIRLVKGPLY